MVQQQDTDTVNIDKLEQIVKNIALPRGRMVGSIGHRISREYLVKELQAAGCVPYCDESYIQCFKRRGQKFYNLTGCIKSSRPDLPPLLIGAHYDSVIPAPCANDNAAAVAIAVEAARILSHRGLERDIVIALFDSEEPPYFHTESMGSTRFFKDQMDSRGVCAALVMDLVRSNKQRG